MVIAQTWLTNNYPWHKRGSITSLELSGKELKGSLKLEGFVNLEQIDCPFNQLTSLQIVDSYKLEKIWCQYNQLEKLVDLQNLPNLKELICNDNNLTELDLSKNDQLKRLNMMDNNLSRRNLSFLSHLNNLEELRIGNWSRERIKKEKYNRLYGSLEFVKGASKLEIIDIRNTDIGDGLWYVPNSVKFFCCVWDIVNTAEVKKISDVFLGEGEKKVKLLGGDTINADCVADFKNKFQVYKLKEKAKARELLKEEMQQLEKERDKMKGLIEIMVGDPWKIRMERFEIEK